MLRTVGVDGVVSGRVDRPGEAAFVARLVAVIGDGQQPFAEHPALGIERQPTVHQRLVAALVERFEVFVQLVEADRPLGEADHGPRPLARIEPGFEPLFASPLAVAELEVEDDAARSGGRLELDQGNTIVAGHAPHRAGALKTGELARLGGIGLDRRKIGRGKRKVADQAVMDRTAAGVGQA